MTITEMFIKNNRPYIVRDKTTKIVVHYVGNPRSTAKNNRDYFANHSDAGVSSNYIIGLDGEVIACIPDNEIAWCSNHANSYSISIECCHPDSTGKFNDKTYKSLVELCVYLCKKYNLKSDDIIRHYDVIGKICPMNFVAKSKGGTDDNTETNYNKFKLDVKLALEPTETLDKDGYKKGSKTIGMLAVKLLLLIAKKLGINKYGMNEDKVFGGGTQNAVNYLLGQWGYIPNGIAGEKFIKRLYAEIMKKL